MQEGGSSGASISVVIPAFNEANRIGPVIEKARDLASEVLVVDDHSADGTPEVAERLGARVVPNSYSKGYLGAIKTGLLSASGDVIVTLDADGEHDPGDIPRLVQPVLDGEADLVLGRRDVAPRVSERFIGWLTRFRVKVDDSCTGFRALTRDLARRMELKARCTCGTFVLEANSYGARIAEVPVTIHAISKPRTICWGHLWQVGYVLRWLLKPPATDHGAAASWRGRPG